MIRTIVTSFLCFVLPVKLSFWLLNLMGHRVHHSAKIGFSLIWISGRLNLAKKVRIGHVNLIKIKNLTIGEYGYIRNFNSIKGPLDVKLADKAAIGYSNRIYRAPHPVTYGDAVLQLGVLTKITGNHRLDCARSIILGDYCTVSGHECQFWTHAYYHDTEGSGRFRVDGPIEIGDNVSIGSRCVITGGVKIPSTSVIGVNAAVTKSLPKAGTYVNQPLRLLEIPRRRREDFKPVPYTGLAEEVFEKKEPQV